MQMQDKHLESLANMIIIKIDVSSLQGLGAGGLLVLSLCLLLPLSPPGASAIAQSGTTGEAIPLDAHPKSESRERAGSRTLAGINAGQRIEVSSCMYICMFRFGVYVTQKPLT